MKYVILLLTTAFALVVDQWSKHVVDTQFRWGESVSVISDIFTLTYVRNRGAAFGLMHAAPSWFREPFFVVIPVVALFVILFLIARLPKGQYATSAALSLILGGALGNLIDRLRFGYVIDFLDFHWKEVYHWPAFNIADACIVVGVSIMFLQSLFLPQTGENSPKEKVF